jgi:hypothetical protein
LLDEMLSGGIAAQLRARGRDAVAVVENTALIGLADDEILAAARTAERALVTCNIRDFVPLDQRYQASGTIHRGLVLVSSKAFPQIDRSSGRWYPPWTTFSARMRCAATRSYSSGAAQRATKCRAWTEGMRFPAGKLGYRGGRLLGSCRRHVTTPTPSAVRTGARRPHRRFLDQPGGSARARMSAGCRTEQDHLLPA